MPEDNTKDAGPTNSPGARNPGTGSPGARSPGASTPGIVSSGGGSPRAGSPGVGSAGAGSPGPTSPGAGSPGAGSPGAGSRGHISPAAGSPVVGSPGPGSRGHISPAAGSPVVGSPGPGSRGNISPGTGSRRQISPTVAGSATGSPGIVTPETVSPVSGSPGSGTPRADSGEHLRSEGNTANPSSGSSQTGASGTSSSTGSRRSSTTARMDSLNTEFIYYSAVLRTYAPGLSRDYDRMTARLWMKKLFGPEYHSTVLKPKRNKYLVFLTITILNDETFGIFRKEPPCGVLAEIKSIPLHKSLPPPAWEMETQWTDTVNDLPKDMKLSDCYLHNSNCPESDLHLAEVLDSSFRFFLWLSRPYVALLQDAEEKTTAACWIQLLCGIASERNDCLEMKKLRNDYMQALLGYIHDLRVEGPFRVMPPSGPIPPLSMMYEHCKGEAGFNDPSSKETDQFLAAQPLPTNGAFAYINVTGELFGNF